MRTNCSTMLNKRGAVEPGGGDGHQPDGKQASPWWRFGASTWLRSSDEASPRLGVEELRTGPDLVIESLVIEWTRSQRLYRCSDGGAHDYPCGFSNHFVDARSCPCCRHG